MVSTANAVLLGRKAQEMREGHLEAVQGVLSPAGRKPNVVGVALGIKWTGGQPTGEPSILVLVNRKVAGVNLLASERIPTAIGGTKTDVLAIGHPFAGAVAVGGSPLARRSRPVKGGYSVGHKDITAGTIATAAYDLLPGSKTDPPATGQGVPKAYYLLSNNHILANGNEASIGDAILQPGAFDGGSNPDDCIGTLSRFVPLEFAPDVPKEQHNNIVDAAIAEVSLSDVDRELYWIGRVNGWRPKVAVNVGLAVQKIGRSSGYSTGQIIAVSATIDVGYGGGKSARLQDQIVAGPLSAPGDSGALITTMDGVAVGLLCAGSPSATIINQIENVRAALMVEIAEQLL